MRFQAGLKGIDLGQNDDAKDRFEAAQRRALARQTGKSVDAIEFDELGIDFIEE